jgi:hypothetical protein
MPSPSDRSDLPVSLDRSALERVLARAAELQAQAAEPGESMTEAELVALANEVGIPAENLRQALAEERTRVALPEPESRGAVGFFGPDAVSASRVVRGTPATILAALDRLMQGDECMQPRRRYAERLTWEPRRDLFGSVRRNLNLGGRGYALTRATEVGATVVALDAERAMVRLDASLEDSRRRSVGLGTLSAGGSAAAGAGVLGVAASVVGGSVAVASIVAGGWVVIGLGGLIAIARRQRSGALRVQTALEQVLDRLEHGDTRRPSAILDGISAVTRGR